MKKATKEQKEQWKKKYGEIHEVFLDRKTETVIDEATGKEKEKVISEGKVFYLRNPDRATIKYASTKVSNGSLENTISAGEVILKKCWLGGDDEINTDDKYFVRATIKAYEILNKVTGFL